MIETPLVQNRVERPLPVRRIRKRRDSRLSPYHTSRPSPRHQTPVASPIHDYPRQNDIDLYQQPPGPSLDIQFLEFYDFQGAHTGNPQLSPVVHHHGLDQTQSHWQPFSDQYTLASTSQNYFPAQEVNTHCRDEVPQSSQALDLSWTNANFLTANARLDADGLSLPGSYGSFDSLMLATPGTGTSSVSEEYPYPGTESTFGLPDTSLDGLKLPDEFYQATGQVLDSSSPANLASPLSPDDFTFEADSFIIPWVAGDVYSTQGPQWSSSTLTPTGPVTTPSMSSQPWNSQQAQESMFQPNMNAGVVTFEPPRGPTYETHRAGEQFLETGQRIFGPDPVSPAWESESEGWIVASYPSSYAASHNSPHSQGSPPSHSASPAHIEPDHHSHVFTSHLKIPKPKAAKGRQRNLTTQEKKSAREVREAKACWACHISKTKCSPCSPGKPCEQCARLVGKRRFCKFTCFNDPLESLYTFMVPDYNMGHFTRAKVERFVTQNAISWGTHHLSIRLSWGYRKLLEAEVVALKLTPSSEMTYSHQAIADGANRPSLSRRLSPPLGIPLAAMEEMEDAYSVYIRNIVQNDLGSFVSIAYDDQDCGFAQQLLGAVCSYYNHGLEADEESLLLRQAIEMLVTSTIIERSLILDTESVKRVQNHMREEYPTDSVPRCAQRQIKLAFFMLQRQRIVSVLKEWGNMMWTIHTASQNDKRWAVGFSVFTMLTLVIDKTLGNAYYFCEGKIEHHGHEAEAERREFRKLVRLTQTELFERCKEIFHWKFKTRKAGKEACNPIRHGMGAFKGRAVDEGIQGLVRDLQGLAIGFDAEIRAHTTFKLQPGQSTTDAPYADAGRLACIFLDDFLERS